MSSSVTLRPGLYRELDRQAYVPIVISHAFLTRNDGTDKTKNLIVEYVSLSPQLSIKTHLMGAIPASKCGFGVDFVCVCQENL